MTSARQPEKRFIGEALGPESGAFANGAAAPGEPPLPRAFRRRDEVLRVAELRRAWRSTKIDRGDVYLKRHWFEVALADGRVAVIYFDRGARRSAPRWWLYTLEPPA
ncbi:MAG: DUF6504 family protein [Vulcanimicrobiaceae bacterium]